MENAMPIVNADEEFNLKYDYSNGSHNVYIGLKGHVRRISFPTAKIAGEFMDSMNLYYRVKEELR